MDTPLPNQQLKRPPVPLDPSALLSPQQMAMRLRTRLRKARVAIERDIGHSLSAIVPPADPKSHSTPSSPAVHFGTLHSPLRHHSGHQPQMLSGRASSYSGEELSALVSTAAMANGTLASEAVALNGSMPMALRRQRSALPATFLQSTLPPSEATTHQHPLDIPSSPPVVAPSTPQVDSSEDEIAHTILMLATPPAARPPSLSESPCQRPMRVHEAGAGTSRRLSFSRCLEEQPAKRPRQADVRAQRAASAQEPVQFSTPNLSQIAALPQRALNAPRSTRHASGSTIRRAHSSGTARRQDP
ncbi:hypothetical protein GQ54DRAFT_147416 [Martensiomyces pterosporus]|nr:hypothetical protein GQ54DRAFT_147416 [Martensiomyces pterosporus]